MVVCHFWTFFCFHLGVFFRVSPNFGCPIIPDVKQEQCYGVKLGEPMLVELLAQLGKSIGKRDTKIASEGQNIVVDNGKRETKQSLVGGG